MATRNTTRRLLQASARSSDRASLELLDRLPDEEREILILSSFYGLAKDEIASLVGISAQWVDALTARAREHLRVLLASRWPGSQAA